MQLALVFVAQRQEGIVLLLLCVCQLLQVLLLLRLQRALKPRNSRPLILDGGWFCVYLMHCVRETDAKTMM